MIDGTGFTADGDLEWAERRERVMQLRAQGVPVAEIVIKLRAEGFGGVTTGHVHRMIRDVANDVRARTVELVEQRFAEHDYRCEWLYAQLQKRLDSADPIDAVSFSNLVRACITVLERQAKLLGLDRERRMPGHGGNDWLDRMSPGELAKTAAAWGLKLPDKFTEAVKGA